MIRGSIHERPFPPNIQTVSGVPQVSYAMGTEGCFPVDEATGGVRLPTDFHIVLTLRMIGAIPLIPPCVFTTYMGTNLPLPCLYHFINNSTYVCMYVCMYVYARTHVRIYGV